jgi:signal transduction histidine kinase
VVNIKVNNEDIIWNNLIPKSKDGKTADSLALLNEMVTTFGKSVSKSVLDNMKVKYGNITFDGIAPFYPVPINLMLPYEDKNLTIDFVAIDPSKPKQVKYQYKLEGYNNDWSPLANSTTATFGNIPEGMYTLKLKALSSSGVWSETEYKFGVLPPWYRTWWAYALYFLLLIGIIWSVVHLRSQQLRREKRILEEKVNLRTHELEMEKEKVESTLAELKSTQAQLIQSEKMASLGELTSGIAHEIQNPLNFVNNFSEVNIELTTELNTELDKTDLPVEEKKNLADILHDITSNQQKINYHGKRADAIVKGMLQHSRSSTGVKERTDINALADEYLRLSYHGIRAKDKEFNAAIKTDFDNSIDKINVVPQDIGRVLLNLYNNAFYTVAEKKKLAGDGYDPTISVITKKSGNQVTITVSDNGGGIPQKALDKIFQPFFTTKPTGQGTGLGLSLSYDIIKAHGGEIKVETEEGEGSEFIICFPI